MKNTWLYRFITILAIIILIVVGLNLITSIQNLLVQVEGSGQNSGMLIKASICIFAGLVLYIMTLQRPVKEVIHEKIIEKEVEKEKAVDEIRETENQEYTIEEINRLVSKILPDDKNITTAEAFIDKLLINLAKEHEFVQSVFFMLDPKDGLYKTIGKYAFHHEEDPKEFKAGETIPGQVAKNKQQIIINDVPKGYIKIISGLGDTSPRYLLFSPVIKGDSCIGILELASFKAINEKTSTLITKLSESLSDKITKFNKA